MGTHAQLGSGAGAGGGGKGQGNFEMPAERLNFEMPAELVKKVVDHCAWRAEKLEEGTPVCPSQSKLELERGAADGGAADEREGLSPWRHSEDLLALHLR